MKKKMVFGVLAFLLVLQAQTVFAADYNADFVTELNRNNIQNIERLLNRRAKEMDLAYCMEYTIKNKADCLDVLRLLVRYGADVNKGIYSTSPPLYIAVVYKRSLEVIRFLLDSGANPNFFSSSLSYYFNSLSRAYSNGDMAIVNLLLDRGANGALLLGGIGYNPKDNQMIQQLISRGVQVRSEAGASALRNAAYGGNLDAVKLLVANGVNINARANDKDDEYIPLGATAASVAYDQGNMDIYDYLKANGARDFEPRQVTQQPTQPAAPAQSTTNVYVQPSTPTQSAPVQPATPTLQNGRYACSGTNMTLTLNNGIVNVYANNSLSSIWQGTYRINGSQLVITVTIAVNEYAQHRGKTFAYTITSSTSFSGSGETWVRTGSY